jgi:hypothetical protein
MTEVWLRAALWLGLALTATLISIRYPRTEAAYATLLMSTGLTFGSISALFGLTHDLIDQAQYSYLIAAVIGSAVVPTLVANAFFVPRYLLPKAEAPSPAGPVPHVMAVAEREG